MTQKKEIMSDMFVYSMLSLFFVLVALVGVLFFNIMFIVLFGYLMRKNETVGKNERQKN